MSKKFLIFVLLIALLISMIDTKKTAEVKKAAKPKVTEPEDDPNDNESAHVDVVDLDDTNFDREMTPDNWLLHVYLNEFAFFDELQDWAHKNEIYIRVGRIDANETDLLSTLNLNNTAPYWVYVKNWTTNYVLEGEPTLREIQHFLQKDHVNHEIPLIYEMYSNEDEDEEDKRDDEEIKKIEQEEKKKKANKKEEKKNNKKDDKKNNNNIKDDKKKKDEVKKSNDAKNNKKVDNKKKDTPPKRDIKEVNKKDNKKNTKKQEDDEEEEEQQNRNNKKDNNKKAPKKVANKKQKDEDEDEEEEQQNNRNNKKNNNKKPAKQEETNEEEENQNEENQENQGEENQNENDESGFPEDPDTIVLNANNFERKTASGTWFVDFYAHWCHNCKDLAPIWAGLATRVKREMGRKVHIAKIDVDKHDAIAEKYKVEFLPGIILFKDGKMYNYGEGEFNEKALLKFINGGYLQAESTDSSNEFVGREPDESDNEQNSENGKRNTAKNGKKNGARRYASSEPEEPSQFEKICGKKCQRFLRSPLFVTSLLGVLVAIFIYLLFIYTPSDDQSFVKKSR